jgi:hypothetical protein
LQSPVVAPAQRIVFSNPAPHMREDQRDTQTGPTEAEANSSVPVVIVFRIVSPQSASVNSFHRKFGVFFAPSIVDNAHMSRKQTLSVFAPPARWKNRAARKTYAALFAPSLFEKQLRNLNGREARFRRARTARGDRGAEAYAMRAAT